MFIYTADFLLHSTFVTQTYITTKKSIMKKMSQIIPLLFTYRSCEHSDVSPKLLSWSGH